MKTAAGFLPAAVFCAVLARPPADFSVLALAASERILSAITVADDFEQIGALLRSAREAAGLEVDDVVFRTRIPRTVVESLEAEDFSSFVSPVYAKSFLSQYSEFLNVDAHPWLDALEPGSFMPGGQLRALLEDPDPQKPEMQQHHEHRGGLLSVLGLLTLSAAVVVGAIKGYEFFEFRFGGEGYRPVQVHRKPAPAMPPEKRPEMKPSIETEDEELAKPPPRAIIVR